MSGKFICCCENPVSKIREYVSCFDFDVLHDADYTNDIANAEHMEKERAEKWLADHNDSWPSTCKTHRAIIIPVEP